MKGPAHRFGAISRSTSVLPPDLGVRGRGEGDFEMVHNKKGSGR